MKVRVRIEGPGLVVTQTEQGVDWQASDADECIAWGHAPDILQAINTARTVYGNLGIRFVEVSIIHIIKHGREFH